jgi:DNA mismatch repair protein MutL
VAAELGSLAQVTEPGKRSEELRKLVACHSAIRAGQKLDRAEMDNLIKELYQTANPLTCPHGRPTMIRVSNAELAKRFGR